MGSFGYKLYLVVYFARILALNPTICFAKSLLFVFCILFPFQFLSMHKCFIHNASLFQLL